MATQKLATWGVWQSKIPPHISLPHWSLLIANGSSWSHYLYLQSCMRVGECIFLKRWITMKSICVTLNDKAGMFERWNFSIKYKHYLPQRLTIIWRDVFVQLTVTVFVAVGNQVNNFMILRFILQEFTFPLKVYKLFISLLIPQKCFFQSFLCDCYTECIGYHGITTHR